MKNFLLFLSFVLWSLLGAKGIEGALPSDEGTGMESVLQAETSTGYILPLVTEMPDEGEAYVDTENLARQYRVVGRGQRLFSVQRMLLGKGSAYRAAKKYLEMLFYTINHSYSSLPCQSWAVSSDHYIFRLRRILI